MILLFALSSLLPRPMDAPPTGVRATGIITDAHSGFLHFVIFSSHYLFFSVRFVMWRVRWVRGPNEKV